MGIHRSPTLFFSYFSTLTGIGCIISPPKSTIWARVTQWIYVALNRRIKKAKGAINKEQGKKSPRVFGSTRGILGFFLWAHSSPKNGLFFPCVISVMLHALRLKTINNKLNDYHMCPVINLLFLPWWKLSCSFLHWSSNSSSSPTRCWVRSPSHFDRATQPIGPF